MPLTQDKFIKPNGAPGGGEQPSQSTTWGETSTGELSNDIWELKTDNVADPNGLLSAPKGSIYFNTALANAWLNSDGADAWTQLVHNGFDGTFKTQSIMVENDPSATIQFAAVGGASEGSIYSSSGNNNLTIQSGDRVTIDATFLQVMGFIEFDIVPAADGVNDKMLVWDNVTKRVGSMDLPTGGNFLDFAEQTTGGVYGMGLDITLGATTAGAFVGYGKIVDISLLASEVVTTTQVDITVPASGIPIPDIATTDLSFIFLTADDTFSVTSTLPTDAMLQDMILLGAVSHLGGAGVITGFQSAQVPGFNVMGAVAKLSGAIGTIREGLAVVANPDLSFGFTEGTLMQIGTNMPSLTDPHDKFIAAMANPQKQYFTQTDFDVGTVTDMDPTTYDNGGVVTNIPGGPDESTIQRMFLALNGAVFIGRGTTIYPDPDAAKLAILSDPFVLNPTVATTGASLVGAFILEKTNTTNLQNATFYPASKFGELGGVAATTAGVAISRVGGPSAHTVTSDSIISDTVYYSKWFVEKTITFTQMQEYVTFVNAGGETQMGIYEDGSGNDLLASTAQTTPVQGLESRALTTPVTITAGSFIWLGIWGDGVQMGTYTSITPSGGAIIAKEQFSSTGLPANHNSAFTTARRVPVTAIS